MKTICPHCNQEFPETPDEYLGMTLECPMCHQNFVCEKLKFCPECGAPNHADALQCSQCGTFFEKPKFCSECGTPNPANAMKCSQCGTFFEKPKFCSECGTPNPANAIQCSQCGTAFPASQQQGETVRQPGQNIPLFGGARSGQQGETVRQPGGENTRISSANNLSFLDKLSMNICELEGISTIIFPPLAIVGVYGAYLFSMAKNPHRKIYWTPYRKFVMPVFSGYCGLCGILLFCYNIMALQYGNWGVLLYGLPLSGLHIQGAITGWNLFNKRIAEDVDYEESEKDISRERLKVFLSLADGFGLGALVPFAGILFLLISGIFLTLYIRKGGTNYRKSLILCGLGIAIQVVTVTLVILSKWW